MTGDEVAYLEQRAEEEIEMARQAEDSRAVQVHYQLANAYLERIHGDPEPTRG